MDTQCIRYASKRAIDEESRTVTFVASTEAVDRHGTRIPVKAWNLEGFNRNPVIGYNHDVYGGGLCNKSDPDDVIGKGYAYTKDLEDDKVADQGGTPAVMLDVTFEDGETNPRAEKIFQKVKNGTLNSVSVGFIENEEGKNVEVLGCEVYEFYSVELLEVSVVNIPANPEAQVTGRMLSMRASQAVANLRQVLGKDFSEIEKMTVGDVLKELEGETGEKKVKVEGSEEFTKALNKATSTMEKLEEELEEKERKIKELEAEGSHSDDDEQILSVEEAEKMLNSKRKSLFKL